MGETKTHMLSLCEDGHPVQQFHIAIGSGGSDKRHEGDKKTPVGEYELGDPRSSEQFGIFIPVDYPTRVQREKGYTGGDIGVHGPPRFWKWLGELTTWADWTRGCVAVGSDETISEIAEWVKKQRPEKISIQ